MSVVVGVLLGFLGCLYYMTFLKQKYRTKDEDTVKGKLVENALHIITSYLIVLQEGLFT